MSSSLSKVKVKLSKALNASYVSESFFKLISQFFNAIELLQSDLYETFWKICSEEIFFLRSEMKLPKFTKM